MNLTSLPNEILEIILAHLEPEDVSNICQVSKIFYNLTHGNPRMKRFPVEQLELLDVEEHVNVNVWRMVSPKPKKKRRPGEYELGKSIEAFCHPTHHSDLFNYIYLFEVRRLAIYGRSNKMRNALKSIPTWWLDSVQTLDISETNCDMDMLKFIPRLRNCPEISIAPHYTLNNVSDILSQTSCLTHLSLRNARTVLCDDKSLDDMVELSHRTIGLSNIEITDGLYNITTKKLIEFLSTARFSEDCSLKFDGLYLNEKELIKVVGEEGNMKESADGSYKFNLGDHDITLIIDEKRVVWILFFSTADYLI